MASEHQVALTRAQRIPAPSSHISKAARQVVPAFLQKLYEMVNDPNNAELIRWSEAGDSFFVLDHERFAHEVLGRWFKHRNFSSFVRQLNMYGFHKIPHLQQGVLKSDSDTEFWNFAHQNFHRGQPDLLCLIQRKKQVPQAGEDGAIDLRDPNTVGLLTGGNAAAGSGAGGAGGAAGSGQQGSGGLSSNQILDIHSIVNGIQAIKRHQTTISAELNELKRSNQLLWQDALAARAKHQKQQDTINRIVKFLAGVFGHHAAAAGGAGGLGLGVAGVNVGVGSNSPGVGGTGQHEKDGMHLDLRGGELGGASGPGARRGMRLMIEDAKHDGPRKSMIEELTEIPMDATEAMFDSTYPTIETPLSAPSPSPSVALSDNITVADTPTPGGYHNGGGGGNTLNRNSGNSKTNSPVVGPAVAGAGGPTDGSARTPSSSSNAPTPSSIGSAVDSPVLGHASATATQQQQQGGSPHLRPASQQQLQQIQQQGKVLSRAVTPNNNSASSASGAPGPGAGVGSSPNATSTSGSRLSPFAFDFHGMLNQLSPAQIQGLLASLGGQTFDSSSSGGGSGGAGGNANFSTINPSATSNNQGHGSGNPTSSNGTLTPYLHPSSFDFSINPASSSSTYSGVSPSSSSSTPMQMQIPLISPEGLIPFDPFDPAFGGLRTPDLGLGHGLGGAGANTNGGVNVNMQAGPGGGGSGGYGGVGAGNVNMNMSITPHQSQSQSLATHDQHDRELEERMHHQWQGTADVDKDLSMVDSSIQSLIQTFGLDPSLLEEPVGANHSSFDSFDSLGTLPLRSSGGDSIGPLDDGVGGMPEGATPAASTTATTSSGATPSTDFDFDAFFNNLSSASSSAAAGGAGAGAAAPAGVGDGAGMPMNYHDMDIVSGGFLSGEHERGPTAPSNTTNAAHRDLTASPLQTIRHVSPGLDSDNANDDSVSSLSSRPTPTPFSADDDDDVGDVDVGGDSSAPAASVPITSAGASANANAATTASTIGRKRKSEIDLDGLAGALDAGGGPPPAAAASGKGGAKAKRRKDK